MKKIFIIILFLTTQVSALTVDTTDRTAVVNFYNNEFLPALAVNNAWNGNTANCVAGDNSSAYKEATTTAVNYFRAMVGLPAALTHDPVLDAKSLKAALIMHAENTLNHSPPTSFACYTDDGKEAAGKSNLSFGAAGAAAVALYIKDSGNGNQAVGHRRWILYPRLSKIGTGSTSNFNSLWVIGNTTTRPNGPDWITWPNAGFIPYQLVSRRWSLSRNTSSSVSFQNAIISMSSNGQNITLTKLANQNGFGDNTLAWEPQNLSFSANNPEQVIDVSVQNILVGGVSVNYSYQVKVIEPKVELIGDVTNDGNINVNDIITLVNIILQSGASTPAADCNSDGNINVNDIICIVNLILKP